MSSPIIVPVPSFSPSSPSHALHVPRATLDSPDESSRVDELNASVEKYDGEITADVGVYV